MNKSIIFILFLSIIGLFGGCSSSSTTPTPAGLSDATIASITAYGTSKGLTFTRTTDDLFYAITKANPSGRVPKANESVKLYYTYIKLDGTILDSTATNQKPPLVFPYLSYNSLLNYAVGFMKEGEKITLVFPATTNSTDPTVVIAELISTRDETEQINEYVKDKYPTQVFKKTVSGLQYLITKASVSGDSVKTAKTVTNTYTGKLLFQNRVRDNNGFPLITDKFDSGGFTFTLNTSAVKPGFEEAIKLIKTGDKGIFIFPSSLGYGKDGIFNSGYRYYSIPPYSPLLFEIEATGITK